MLAYYTPTMEARGEGGAPLTHTGPGKFFVTLTHGHSLTLVQVRRRQTSLGVRRNGATPSADGGAGRLGSSSLRRGALGGSPPTSSCLPRATTHECGIPKSSGLTPSCGRAKQAVQRAPPRGGLWVWDGSARPFRELTTFVPPHTHITTTTRRSSLDLSLQDCSVQGLLRLHDGAPVNFPSVSYRVGLAVLCGRAMLWGKKVHWKHQLWIRPIRGPNVKQWLWFLLESGLLSML